MRGGKPPALAVERIQTYCLAVQRHNSQKRKRVKTVRPASTVGEEMMMSRLQKSGRRVRVPGDLPDAVRGVFAEHLLMPEAFGLSEELCRVLSGFRPRRSYASGYVLVDARELGMIRALAELETIDGEPECGSVLAADGEAHEDGQRCGRCTYCLAEALVVQIDFWVTAEAADNSPSALRAEEEWFACYRDRSIPASVAN